MKIDKETLDKYIAAIESLIDSNLFHLDDLSQLVKSLIANIPKLSECLELDNSYDIDEKMLIEAVKHITRRFDEFDVLSAFSEFHNNLEIDYRVISWMRNCIETILPAEEIHKMIKDKNHAKFIFDTCHDFEILYDTNIETNEFDFLEFKDFNNQEINLDFIDLSYFSSKSFGMFLELDKYALDIDTGNKYKFENGVLQIFSNGEYIAAHKVMSASEIAELFSHRFEKDSAYED